MVDVAQLVRASVCGAEGRGFESHLPPTIRGLVFTRPFFIHKKKRVAPRWMVVKCTILKAIHNLGIPQSK